MTNKQRADDNTTNNNKETTTTTTTTKENERVSVIASVPRPSARWYL
jgi:hypothetical protein